MIHPYIRLLMLILLTLSLSVFGALAVNGVLLAAMIAVLALLRVDVLRLSWRGVLRLRYLFLSIIVLYGWYSPGALAWPQLGAWSPSLDGVYQGAERVTMLLTVIIAVQWLIATTAKESIYSALVWWLNPATRIGLPVERFALRLALTLHALPQIRQFVTTSGVVGDGVISANRWQRAGRSAAAIYTAVRDDASGDTPAWEPPVAVAAPTITQWLWPIALTMVIVALNGALGAQ